MTSKEWYLIDTLTIQLRHFRDRDNLELADTEIDKLLDEAKRHLDEWKPALWSGGRLDLTGQRFGKLSVEELVVSPLAKHKGRKKWRCRCDCGEICYHSAGFLRYGGAMSCGCGKFWRFTRKMKGEL